MAFTWTGDPANSNIEAIRWYIDDTASSNAKFQDAEITYAYNQEVSILGASALLCEQLAAKYAGEANRSLGPMSISLSNLSKQYENKAQMYRRRKIAYAKPYAANISETDRDTWEDDSDVNQPVFEKDMHKNS